MRGANSEDFPDQANFRQLKDQGLLSSPEDAAAIGWYVGLSPLDLDLRGVHTVPDLLADVPAGKTVVSESGIYGRDQLDELELVALSKYVMSQMRVHPGADLCLRLVDEAAMEVLHVQWMDLPGPTDVMSFPMDELEPGGKHLMNVWQGVFPTSNTEADGHYGPAPAKSYRANGHGSWPWCRSGKLA